MATKNTTPAVEETPVVDEWSIMKTIHLPRPGKNEAKSEFVAVNGRTFNVPKGKDVEVPLPVYERLMIVAAAKDADDEYRENIPNDI